MTAADVPAMRDVLDLGTSALLDADTDPTMSANSNSVVPTQQAVRGFVENALTGFSWKYSVRVVCTSNRALTGLTAIDGVSLSNDDRVLLVGQTDSTENGIWLANSGAWSRSSDANTGYEIWGMAVYARASVSYPNGSHWVLLNDVEPTIGSDDLVYGLFGAGTSYVADEGTLTLSGNEFSVKNGGVGTNQLAPGAVTLSRLADMATASLIGRDTAGTGAPEVLSPTTVRSILALTALAMASVDNSTVELNSSTLRIKDSGVVTAKIADANVTLPKLANISQYQFLGRSSSGAGAPQAISSNSYIYGLLSQSSAGAARSYFGLGTLAELNILDALGENVTQASHGFALGDIIVWNGSQWVKADRSSINSSHVVSAVVIVNSTSNFIRATLGKYEHNSHGITVGRPFYLGATAGTITETRPTAGQRVMLGYAVTNKDLFFFPQRPEDSELDKAASASALAKSLWTDTTTQAARTRLWSLFTANQAKSASYTAVTGDVGQVIDMTTGASNRVVTLPTVTGLDGSGEGWALVIRKADSGVGNVTTSPATGTLTAQGDSMIVVRTGGAWVVVAKNTSGGGGGGENLAATLAIDNNTGGTDIEVDYGDVIDFFDSTYKASLQADSLTADRVHKLPNIGGTLAVHRATVYREYHAAGMRPNDTDAPTPGGGEVGSFAVDWLAFPPSATRYADIMITPPDGYAGGTITVQFYWRSASGSGDVRWFARAGHIGDGTAISTTLLSSATNIDDTRSGSTLLISSPTASITPGGTWAAGTSMLLRVGRDGSLSGLAVDAHLIMVKVSFPVTQA